MSTIYNLTKDNLVSALYIFAEMDSELHFYIHNDILHVAVDCSDDFVWGCADSEILTNSDMPLLRQTYLDVVTMLNGESKTRYGVYFSTLYSARKRKTLPNNAIDYFRFNRWPESIRSGWIKLLQEAESYSITDKEAK